MKKTTKKTIGWASAVLTSAGMLFAGMTVLPAGAASPAKRADTSHHSHSEGRAIDWSSARSSGHSWPLVKTGHRGTNVRTAQHLLAAAGYRLEVDGAFGPKTASSMKAFQKRHGLQADGIVGPNTWNALLTTVRSGSSGHAVVAVQDLLTAHGHSVTSDGAFGSLTAAAVSAFQKSRSLEADGVVGPNTWNALLTAPTGTKPAPSGNAKPGPSGYYLKFTKNWKAPTWSTLSLVRDGKVVKSYRAGSGMGVTDECVSDEGWLPSGAYQIKGHETSRNSRFYDLGIKGYAIQLADKMCVPKPGQKPVKRFGMFIHSEMRSNGEQAPNTPFDDDYYRWNGDMDYKSNGCIKLKPADIKDLFARLDQANWPKNLTLRVS